MIKMRLDGGIQLARALNALPSRVSRSVLRDALYAGGEEMRRVASTMAPRAPGAPDLATNIRMSNARPDDRSVGVAIGPTQNFFYGYFQEFGTSKHGAHPFLRPAFDTEQSRTLQIITGELWAALIGRGGGSTRGSGGGGGLL